MWVCGAKGEYARNSKGGLSIVHHIETVLYDIKEDPRGRWWGGGGGGQGHPSHPFWETPNVVERGSFCACLCKCTTF